MLFNIEQDYGHHLSGYIVCDGFEGIVNIAVSSGGAVVYEGPADHERESLVRAGRHKTGRCGFAIDENIVPGLSGMRDLEIRDAASQILIYRRAIAEHTQKRVIRLETHLFPLWRLDRHLSERFQYAANQIEGQGLETTTQMFQINGTQSVYLSGRIHYRAFQHYIDRNYEVIFSMHHPYEELAERLTVLRQIKTMNSNILGSRENMSLESAMDFAQSLSFDNERKLARSLRDMPHSVARVLANPVLRQLTTLTPEEMPTKSAVSMALSTLSGFHVVGLRRAPKSFASAVAALTQSNYTEMPILDQLPGVITLARILKRSQEVDWLIEQDLALYNYIADAYRSAATPTTAGSSGDPSVV